MTYPNYITNPNRMDRQIRKHNEKLIREFKKQHGGKLK